CLSETDDVGAETNTSPLQPVHASNPRPHAHTHTHTHTQTHTHTHTHTHTQLDNTNRLTHTHTHTQLDNTNRLKLLQLVMRGHKQSFDNLMNNLQFLPVKTLIISHIL